MIPCGLGARNTLRLESGMASTGMKSTTRPLRGKQGSDGSANWKRARFRASDALAQQKQAGVRRKLVGFEMLDKRIGRDGYPGVDRRLRSRLRNQRRTCAVSEEKYWHGVCAAGVERGGIEYRNRNSRTIGAAREIVPLPFYKRPQ